MSSGKQKQRMDAEAEGCKEDFSVHTCNGKMSKPPLVFVCKSLRNDSNSSDLVKIGWDMKDTLLEDLKDAFADIPFIIA